jgi:hypothetical protein
MQSELGIGKTQPPVDTFGMIAHDCGEHDLGSGKLLLCQSLPGCSDVTRHGDLTPLRHGWGKLLQQSKGQSTFAPGY